MNKRKTERKIIKEEATKLANLIYDIYKEKKLKEKKDDVPSDI